MRSRPALLAAALLIAPLGARATDLVVWWEEGQSAEESEAVGEIVAAFEQNTGKQVQLVLGPQEKLVGDLVAALEAGRRTPDFIFTVISIQHYEQWAYEGRLVDLTDAVGHFSDLFDQDALQRVTLLDGTTGRRGLFLLPMGFATHHVHVWKNLLEQTSLRTGKHSGRSGATRSNPPCARHSAATTSGAWAFPCLWSQSTRLTRSGSSCTPTTPTM